MTVKSNHRTGLVQKTRAELYPRYLTAQSLGVDSIGLMRKL
jgi:hypothetical protein